MCHRNRPTVPPFLAIHAIGISILVLFAPPASAQALTPIATLVGTDNGEYLGTTTAIVGDVDRDGFADYLVGEPGLSPNGTFYAGSAILYSGRTGSILHRVDGTQVGEQRGWVAALGDVNRDSIPDYAVGAPALAYGQFAGAGSIWVISGATNSILYEVHGSTDNAKFGLVMAGIGDADGDSVSDFIVGAASLDSGVAYVLSGVDGSVIRTFVGQFSGQHFGFSAAGVGDMNGDGLADVIIGAPSTGDPSSQGSAQIFSPKTGAALGGLISNVTGDEFGYSVAGIGDINGDGVPDWMAGAPTQGYQGLTANGAAYVFSGATGAVLYAIRGGSSGDEWGTVVAGVGTVNGDAIPDFAIGSPLVRPSGGSQQVGAAIVYSGAGAAPLFQVGPDLAVPSEGDWISGGGDIDGDGNQDVIISASRYTARYQYTMITYAGRVDILGYPTTPKFVYMDLLPGTCPNTPGASPDSLVPVLILGAPDFDASLLIPETVRLNGIAPHAIHVGVFDEGGHAAWESSPCDCHDLGPDGYPDKSLRFAYSELAPTLEGGRTSSGSVVRLTGRLVDGTRIESVDCFALPAPHARVAPNPTRRAAGSSVFFEVPAGGSDVEITIHDARGQLVRKVARQRMSPGPQSVRWDCRAANGTPVPGGLYFVKTVIAGRETSSRMVVVP